MIDFDLQDGRIDLDGLKKHDGTNKPDEFNSSIAELVALFEDGAEARALTRTYLHQLGLGLRDNQRAPLQHGVMEFVVERLSGRYDGPATRRLRRGDRMLSETGTEHRRMIEVLGILGFDGVLAEADRYSTLCGSVFLRFYPTTRGLRARLFTPDLVMRVPDPALADEIEYDSAFALRLAGDIHELHLIDEDGRRRMFRVGKEGEILADQPFGSEGRYPETYNEVLPIVRLDSAPTVGRAWLQPRLSRSAYVKALSGLQADLQAMTAHQAHAQLVYMTSAAERNPPEGHGPGSVIKIDSEDELRYETPQPLISQVVDVLDRLTQSFLFGERIPVAEARGDAAPTGAALKVQERALRSRREAGRPLAVAAERAAWRVITTLHNAHLPEGAAPLATDTELVTSLASVDQPEDDGAILHNGAQAMALGIASPVSVAQRLHGVSRDQAIAIVEQARADKETYPPPAAEAARQVDQGAAADVIAAANGQPSGDSVIDAATGRTAADARAERRNDA